MALGSAEVALSGVLMWRSSEGKWSFSCRNAWYGGNLVVQLRKSKANSLKTGLAACAGVASRGSRRRKHLCEGNSTPQVLC